MALCFPGAPRRAAISGAVVLLLLALCGAAQGGSVAQEDVSTLAAQEETVLGPRGRALLQGTSTCNDCGCARVECAISCESASNIRNFTCDEAGWFTNGKWFCECLRSTGGGGSAVSSAPAVGSLGRLTLAVSAAICMMFFAAM